MSFFTRASVREHVWEAEGSSGGGCDGGACELALVHDTSMRLQQFHYGFCDKEDQRLPLTLSSTPLLQYMLLYSTATAKVAFLPPPGIFLINSMRRLTVRLHSMTAVTATRIFHV